ncbi:MgtC/SapB family protein [Aliikangiella sp. G2MR2-5]|uniref:MgtC/SapB family protein n=1 Tax=Aliikangiella sp. G2MR2-5 TaxID=2788943 RepID=UPI0018AB935E|nr:MgtC/SapB family protein [Aliikangiella sp. G2MR2-5]
MEQIQVVIDVLIAMGLGLLIGLERSWYSYQHSDQEHVAGIRTFGLIGLLGGISGTSAQASTPWWLVTMAAIVGILAFAGYQQIGKQQQRIGLTTIVTIPLTFSLGALCTIGFSWLAAPVAVVATILLGMKLPLHGFVEKIEPDELYATFKFALVALVILPILPNETFDPWQVLNPHHIWWMVVIIAAISYIGYFSVKYIGPTKGSILTGFFGGLASSTATTLEFSRQVRMAPEAAAPLAVGILAACGTMFPRILVITLVFESRLTWSLALPLTTMTVLTYLAAYLLWWRNQSTEVTALNQMRNPFVLFPALAFAAFLAVVLLATKLIQAELGETGIYVFSAFSGIADLDAIALSISKSASADLSIKTASIAVLIAAVTNNVMKTTLAFIVGGRVIGGYVAGGLGVATFLGLVPLLWQ